MVSHTWAQGLFIHELSDRQDFFRLSSTHWSWSCYPAIRGPIQQVRVKQFMELEIKFANQHRD